MAIMGHGQFAGSLHPQDLGLATRRGMFTPTLSGEPGLRVARSRAAWASILWTGTNLAMQEFVRQQAGPNSVEALSAMTNAPLKRNRSRSLGQMRGFPYMANPDV